LFLPANFSVLSFAPVAAFETANFVAKERFYDLREWKADSEFAGRDRGYRVHGGTLI